MAKIRFNPEDLEKIETEYKALQERLSRLSKLMLEANIRATGERFYSAEVRRVADSLPGRLHALENLLWHERQRHPIQDAPPEARRFEVRP